MIQKPTIVLLCHSRMAIPALRHLHEKGVLAAVAVPVLGNQVHELFVALTAQLSVPLLLLTREDYKETLSREPLVRNATACFVIAFPWRLPAGLLQSVPYGFLNFHGGLLPQMRGSDPMFYCIKNKITGTGLTVHQMDAGMDTGPIVLQKPATIAPDTTHGILSTRLAFACEQAVAELLPLITFGRPLSHTPQDEAQAHYIPAPTQEDTFVDWDTMTAADICALANACNPQLKGAGTAFGNWKFGITNATEINLTGDAAHLKPGTILYAAPDQGLIVYCTGGKGLRLDVVYTEEGCFPGYRLAQQGLVPGAVLTRAAAKMAEEPA